MLKVDQLQGDVKPKHPWKIYALTAFAVLSLIFVNAWSPAKNALYDLGVKIHSFGILGPLLFLLFNGLIIIPLALPYIVFEMVIALIIPDFIYSVSFSLLGKMLGAGVSYIVTKYTLKQKIRNSFKDMKAFKGIEHVLQKDPIKFSLILRIVTIPLFLKNYGLAVPDNVTFKLYMLCTFIATIPTTAMNIYLFQETGNLANAFSADKSWLHKTFSIAMITVSVLLMVYVVRYTKKLIKELEKLSYEEIKMTEKPAHIELEIISTLDINMKNIEIVNTEEEVALQDENPVDGKMELYLNKLAL